ncbi:MAG: hypothetical protein E7Z69_02250 [Thermoplasmata archaeon]|nr:hypothetical protein [Thermoplasmata archaeon]
MKNTTAIIIAISTLAVLCAAPLIAMDGEAAITISDETLNGQGNTSALPNAPDLAISAEYHITGTKHILYLSIPDLEYPLPVRVSIGEYDPATPASISEVYKTNGGIPHSRQVYLILDGALAQTNDSLRYEVFVYDYPGTAVLAQATLFVQQYKVSFDANGGSGISPDQMLDYGTAPILPAAGTFYKDYHTFIHYSKTDNGGEEAISAFNKDTLLFAVYSPNEYTVSFDGNLPEADPSQSMSSVTMTYGTESVLPQNTFSAEGYAFMGWARSPSGDVAYADGATVSNIYTVSGVSPAVAGDATLYAKWQASSFSVVYDGNRPSDATSDTVGIPLGAIPASAGSTFTAADAPSLTGWTFEEWNTERDGTGNGYASGSEVTGLIGDDGGTISLFAIWSQNAYTISYDANVPGDATAPVPMPTIPPTEAFYDSLVELSDIVPVIDGWTFISWNTAADGSGIGYPSGSSGKLNLESTDGGTATLYAQYSQDAYPITVVKADASHPLTFAHPSAVYRDDNARAIVVVTSEAAGVYFTATVSGATFESGSTTASSHDGILILKDFTGPITVTVTQHSDPLSDGAAGRFAIERITNTEGGNTVVLYIDSHPTTVLPAGSVTLEGTYFDAIGSGSQTTYAYGNLNDDNLSSAAWEITVKKTGSISNEFRYDQPYLDVSSGWKSCDAVMKPDVDVYSASALFTPEGQDECTDRTAWVICAPS